MTPILRDIARGLVALALALMLISGVAGLAGCQATRAFSTAPPPQATAQLVDCRQWQECA